jgi:hypothetical protein
MAVIRDNNDERNARVEHMLEDLRRAQAKATQLIEEAKRTVGRTRATITNIERQLKRKARDNSRR